MSQNPTKKLYLEPNLLRCTCLISVSERSTARTIKHTGMKAKKSFGQHFLKEAPIAERIAKSLENLSAYEQILEIGPGQGMLTQFLLEISEKELTVVEADRDMIAYVKQHFPDLQERIVEADFLKYDWVNHFSGPFAIIGNFPYNISSQILIKTVEMRHRIPELVGMFQREMAERVAAPPGSKTYGSLSVWVQAFYEVELLFRVKPGSFNPPPNVQSAVIRLARRKSPALDCDEILFHQVVRQAFSQRRKMLRNTLKPFLPKEELQEEAFFRQRPEVLSVADYEALTQRIMAHRGS